MFPLYSFLRERYPIPRTLFHSSFKVPGRRAPFQVPQQDPYGERCLSPEPSFTHTPGSPSKGAPPLQVPLIELPQRERCSTSRTPFVHLSKSLVNETPSRFPSRSPMERCLSPESFLQILQGPQLRSSLRERRSTSRAPSTHLSKVPGPEKSSVHTRTHARTHTHTHTHTRAHRDHQQIKGFDKHKKYC
jgi:hypothetical protein